MNVIGKIMHRVRSKAEFEHLWAHKSFRSTSYFVVKYLNDVFYDSAVVTCFGILRNVAR